MKQVDLLLIAVGLSMDAFAVAVTNGMTMPRLRLKHYLIISLAFGFFQGLMPSLGYFLGHRLEFFINTFAHWTALILLAAIGGKMIVEGVRCKNEECRIKCFSLKLVIIQAVATSIDALMAGVTFAAMHVTLSFSVSVIAVTTFLISFAGVLMGKKFGGMLKAKSEIFGGAILVLIGLKIFFEHGQNAVPIIVEFSKLL